MKKRTGRPPKALEEQKRFRELREEYQRQVNSVVRLEKEKHATADEIKTLKRENAVLQDKLGRTASQFNDCLEALRLLANLTNKAFKS